MFLRGLNGAVQAEMDTAVLHSPLTGKAESEKYYAYEKAKDINFSQGKYAGTLYVAMNKETGSSAENAAAFSRACRWVVTLGAPTAGIGIFGEVRPYRLEHSDILVLLPYKVFFEEDFEIGKGKFPDYWIDNEEPVAYLLQCLGK